jgi:hypothetical protein
MQWEDLLDSPAISAMLRKLIEEFIQLQDENKLLCQTNQELETVVETLKTQLAAEPELRKQIREECVSHPTPKGGGL